LHFFKCNFLQISIFLAKTTDALPLQEAAIENHIEAWTVIVVQTVTADQSVATETATIVTATMEVVTLLLLDTALTVHMGVMVDEA
jgi:hypothetical protein